MLAGRRHRGQLVGATAAALPPPPAGCFRPRFDPALAAPARRQIDFLPFPCSGCGKVYCLQHRVCPECSEASKQSVVVCPLCAQAVVARPGEDVELAFDRWAEGAAQLACDRA